VITDLGMPDVPGWELVEAVNRSARRRPVVILSGVDRTRATRRARARELGVDLVISKPFDIQEFLTTVCGCWPAACAAGHLVTPRHRWSFSELDSILGASHTNQSPTTTKTCKQQGRGRKKIVLGFLVG
jgi:DNA-binding NarL/FixJ family response regulator